MQGWFKWPRAALDEKNGPAQPQTEQEEKGVRLQRQNQEEEVQQNGAREHRPTVMEPRFFETTPYTVNWSKLSRAALDEWRRDEPLKGQEEGSVRLDSKNQEQELQQNGARELRPTAIEPQYCGTTPYTMQGWSKVSRASLDEGGLDEPSNEQEEESFGLNRKNREQEMQQIGSQEQQQGAMRNPGSSDLNLKKASHVNLMSNQKNVPQVDRDALEEKKRLNQLEQLQKLVQSGRGSLHTTFQERHFQCRREADSYPMRMYEGGSSGGDASDNKPAELVSNPDTKTSTVTVDGKTIPCPKTIQEPKTPDQNPPASTTTTWSHAFMIILGANFLLFLNISGGGPFDHILARYLHKIFIAILSVFPEPVLKLVLALVNQNGCTVVATLFVTSILVSFALYALGCFLLDCLRPRVDIFGVKVGLWLTWWGLRWCWNWWREG